MSLPFQFIKLSLSILFIALSAQLSIDLPIGQTMIPITGQTFAVLLVGYFLGPIKGTIAVLAYVVLGLIGLPIFADGKSGLSVLTSGSGGYLVGFVAGAAIVGYCRNVDNQPSFIRTIWIMAVGTVVILLFGVGRLIQLYGLDKGLAYGFYPFWRGALIKVLLGALVAWGIQHLKPRIINDLR